MCDDGIHACTPFYLMSHDSHCDILLIEFDGDPVLSHHDLNATIATSSWTARLPRRSVFLFQITSRMGSFLISSMVAMLVTKP